MWDGGTAPAAAAVTLSCALSLQVPQDTRAAELGRAPLQVQRCSHCSSPGALGVQGAQGTPAAGDPSSLCPQCSELRSELEALSEEYQSCLTRLRQCRAELGRSQGSQAQVGAPVPSPGWHRHPCAVQREEWHVCQGWGEKCLSQLTPSNTSFSWQRQRGPWIPLLVAVAAVAIATFLASYSL